MKLILTERDEKLIFHYIMLTRQLTRLADCFTHIARLATQKDGTHGSKKLDFVGYRAWAQTEISDVICQCEKLCDILGLNFSDTAKMGFIRDEEKKKEYLKEHPNDEWI